MRLVHSLGSRVKAARALGGFASQRALADAVNRAGLSERTLRAVESGETTTLEDYKRQWIATACGIDVRFFDVDLSNLTALDELPSAEASPEAVAAILRRLADEVAQARHPSAGGPQTGSDDTGHPPAVGEGRGA